MHAKITAPIIIVIGRKQLSMEMTTIGQSAVQTAAAPFTLSGTFSPSIKETVPENTKKTARFPTAPETADASTPAHVAIRLKDRTGQILSIPLLQIAAQDSQSAFFSEYSLIQFLCGIVFHASPAAV